MDDLLPLAERIASLLKERGETIAIAESSTGGLVSAALLAVPGASAYFLGGGVVYTRVARTALLDIRDAEVSGMRSSTEAYALLLAQGAAAPRGNLGVGESGAAGPTGNRYGDVAGHTCLAVVGPAERAITLETGSAERVANMGAFAAAALELLAQTMTDHRDGVTER